MSFVNSIILEGIISDYPEIVYFDYERSRLTFKLETTESGLKTDGEDWVQWHNIELNNQLAQEGEDLLKRGDRVRIEGRIAYHKDFDNEGRKFYKTVIYARSFKRLTSINIDEQALQQPQKKELDVISNSIGEEDEASWQAFTVNDNEDPMA